MANVINMPLFKKNATAAERFYELARHAEECPELYDAVVVVYTSSADYDGPAVRHACVNCTYAQALGTLQMGISSLLKDLRD